MKILLDSQNQAFRSALDIVVDQFNSRIATMETKISDLIRSLEFSQAEVSDLEAEVKALRKCEKEHEAVIEELKNRVEDL